jgi:hypothetical protein
MSKKRKRQISSTTHLEETRSPAVGSVPRSPRETFNPNYAPVIKDLKAYRRISRILSCDHGSAGYILSLSNISTPQGGYDHPTHALVNAD